MADRRFIDCDGDTWVECEPGVVRLTERANGATLFVGWTSSIEDVRDLHGPLTEILPDVNVRALLASVLEDLAAELRRTTDLPGVLTSKAGELREAGAGE